MKIYTIYKCTNKINQKSYIGFDSNWPNRKNRHKYECLKRNTKFYAAIRKYGWDSFDWMILYQSKDRNHTLNKMENFFIVEYDTINFGYNLIPGGSKRADFKQTEETKKKISTKLKGRTRSEEQKNNMRGKVRSEEHRKKLSLSQKGKSRSLESVVKRKITMEKKGQYFLSEDHKKKISLSNKGKKKPSYHKGRSKSITIDGIFYNSLKEAKDKLKINNRKLYKLLESNNSI